MELNAINVGPPEGTAEVGLPPEAIFAEGDAVEANWGGQGEYHAGTIAAVHGGSGLYDVAFEDGAVEAHVEAARIRPRPGVHPAFGRFLPPEPEQEPEPAPAVGAWRWTLPLTRALIGWGMEGSPQRHSTGRPPNAHGKKCLMIWPRLRRRYSHFWLAKL
jgi:hypothetical protein